MSKETFVKLTQDEVDKIFIKKELLNYFDEHIKKKGPNSTLTSIIGSDLLTFKEAFYLLKTQKELYSEFSVWRTLLDREDADSDGVVVFCKDENSQTLADILLLTNRLLFRGTCDLFTSFDFEGILSRRAVEDYFYSGKFDKQLNEKTFEELIELAKDISNDLFWKFILDFPKVKNVLDSEK